MKVTHSAGLLAALILLFTAQTASPQAGGGTNGTPDLQKAAGSQGQGQTESGSQDCDLDSVCRSLTKHAATTGSFVMKRRIASVNRELASSGNFIICGEGIAWNTTRPLRTLLAVTEDKIIQQLPDGSKNVMDGSGNQTFQSIATTLSSLFSGDRAALEKNFDISFSSSGGNWQMTLLPKDSSVASMMTSIVMEGLQEENGGETFLNTLRIEEKAGGRITYSFSDLQHKDSLEEHEKAYFAAN